MTPHKEGESISRIFRPIKDIFRTPPRQAQSVAAQEAGSISLGPLSGFEPGLLTPDPTPSKRRASTSAPSSPTTTRPSSKRRILKLPSRLFSRIIARPAQLPSPPAVASPPSLVPRHTETVLDAVADSDSDRLSLQRSCQASQSADSLASDRGRARASARASSSSSYERNAALVLKTIKEVKGETYKVEKGWHGGKYLVERKLPWAAYNLLLKKLEQEDEKLRDKDEETLSGYFDHRLRYDYTTRPHKDDERHFTIHMPSHMHEGMAGALEKVIINWLGQVEKGQHCKSEETLKSTKLIAKEIWPKLATRVKFDDKARQEPDLSFSFNRAKQAGLLIEVAWSQYKLKLAERADRYIKGTRGKVRTVIGINLNDIYKGGREAWFSVWNARYDGKNKRWTREIIVDQQMFIGEDGKPINGCPLRLSLKDFLCEEDASEQDDFEDVSLDISSEELHRFFENSLQPHVCAEIDDEEVLISKDVKEDLGKVIEVERILQELKVPTSGEQKTRGLKELARARELLTDAENHITKRRHNMQFLKTNLERVGSDKSRDVRDAKQVLVKMENEVAEFEKKILEKKSEVEGRAAPESKEAASERKTRQSSRINAAEPSVAQSSGETPLSSATAVKKSKARLS